MQECRNCIVCSDIRGQYFHFAQLSFTLRLLLHVHFSRAPRTASRENESSVNDPIYQFPLADDFIERVTFSIAVIRK